MSEISSVLDVSPVGCIGRIEKNNSKKALAIKVYSQQERISQLEEAVRQLYITAQKNDFEAPNRESWNRALSLVDVSGIKVERPLQ